MLFIDLFMLSNVFHRFSMLLQMVFKFFIRLTKVFYGFGEKSTTIQQITFLGLAARPGGEVRSSLTVLFPPS